MVIVQVVIMGFTVKGIEKKRGQIWEQDHAMVINGYFKHRLVLVHKFILTINVIKQCLVNQYQL